MKNLVRNIFRVGGIELRRIDSRQQVYERLYDKYQGFTMMSKTRFISNLELCDQFSRVDGDYVECGVWKGGMSAAFAELLGKKKTIHLFDSFEGLPEAKPIDGKAALTWQSDVTSPSYYDNCRAEEKFAIEAMKMANHENYKLYKGWFEKTLPSFNATRIAILRLDGDWYDSIMTSLVYLYPMVAENGLIILDDYPDWAGCSKAVHRYLADIESSSRIHEIGNGVTYLIKKEL